MSRTFRDEFLDRLCQVDRWIRMLFGVSIALIIFMFGSLVIADSGSGAYVVAVLNIVGLSIIAIVSGVMLLICRNRRER